MVLGVGSIVGFASDRAWTLGGYGVARNRRDNADRGRCPADRVGGAGGQAARARRGTPRPGHRAVRVTDRGRAHHRTNVLSVAVLSRRTGRPPGPPRKNGNRKYICTVMSAATISNAHSAMSEARRTAA